MNIKVSALIIIYNHEKCIAQAVENTLHQEVDFQYEIVNGDDCSTDHTPEILKELSKRHPERIRLLLREKSRPVGTGFTIASSGMCGELGT